MFKHRRVAKRSVEPSHDYEQLLAGEPQVGLLSVDKNNNNNNNSNNKNNDNVIMDPRHGWLGSRVVSVLDSGAVGKKVKVAHTRLPSVGFRS